MSASAYLDHELDLREEVLANLETCADCGEFMADSESQTVPVCIGEDGDGWNEPRAGVTREVEAADHTDLVADPVNPYVCQHCAAERNNRHSNAARRALAEVQGHRTHLGNVRREVDATQWRDRSRCLVAAEVESLVHRLTAETGLDVADVLTAASQRIACEHDFADD